MTSTTYTPDGLFAIETAGTTLVHKDDGMADGERRRNAAVALLSRSRAVLVRRGCRLFVARLLANGTATADDIAGDLDTPPGIDRRLVGTIPLSLAKAGVVTLVGYRRSRRASRHASILAVWRLADRDAALAWLADHPDLPDPLDLDADRAGARRQMNLF